MAVLAAYLLRADTGQSLPDYLDERIAGSIGEPVRPRPARRDGLRRRSSRDIGRGWRSNARR